jgi:hypothetical protein
MLCWTKSRILILNTTPTPTPRVFKIRKFNRRNDFRVESNPGINLIGFEFKPEFDGLDSDCK